MQSETLFLAGKQHSALYLYRWFLVNQTDTVVVLGAEVARSDIYFVIQFPERTLNAFSVRFVYGGLAVDDASDCFETYTGVLCYVLDGYTFCHFVCNTFGRTGA